MIAVSGGALLGTIQATPVSGRGFTPEELADHALDQIIFVGQSAHPAIRDQAEAFREHIRTILIRYGHQCVKSEHTTLANKLRKAGYSDVAVLLEK